MEMIHGLSEMLDTQLAQSEADSTATFEAFSHFDILKAETREKFVKSKDGYAMTLTDAKDAYFQLHDAVDCPSRKKEDEEKEEKEEAGSVFF